jgi:hypothetical protein
MPSSRFGLPNSPSPKYHFGLESLAVDFKLQINYRLQKEFWFTFLYVVSVLLKCHRIRVF